MTAPATTTRRALSLLAAALLLAGGCGGSEEPAGVPTSSGTVSEAAPPPLPRGSEPVELDPADLVATVDNPYWPMAPGSRWVYRETDGRGGEQRVEVTVTDETKTILGVEATVVHDVVTEDGEVIEDTYDWFAQDRWGNVWYLGEATTEYEAGKATTAGSWEAGVDGAEAGIVMPGSPEPGMSYRQEYYEGEAEDGGEVLSLSEQAEVPFGAFRNVLMTKDFTPLQPEILEHKFYVEGIGPVLALTVAGGSDREELVSFESG
jgi:hypothetical protein